MKNGHIVLNLAVVPNFYIGVNVNTFAQNAILTDDGIFTHLTMIPYRGPITNLCVRGYFSSRMNAKSHDDILPLHKQMDDEAIQCGTASFVVKLNKDADRHDSIHSTNVPRHLCTTARILPQPQVTIAARSSSFPIPYAGVQLPDFPHNVNRTKADGHMHLITANA